jgi:hypothetical protein
MTVRERARRDPLAAHALLTFAVIVAVTTVSVVCAVTGAGVTTAEVAVMFTAMLAGIAAIITSTVWAARRLR